MSAENLNIKYKITRAYNSSDSSPIYQYTDNKGLKHTIKKGHPFYDYIRKNESSSYISGKGGLHDSVRKVTYYLGSNGRGRVFASDGRKGTWDTTKHRMIGWDKSAPEKSAPEKSAPEKSAPAVPKWNYGDPFFNGDAYKTRQEAFNAARAAGRGVFTWKGNHYNTMVAGENRDDYRAKHGDFDYYLGSASTIQDKTWDKSPQHMRTIDYGNEYVPQTPKWTPKPYVPTTPTTANQPLTMFSKDDIRGLKFNTYSGMVDAIKNNPNNNFSRAMTTRYGSNFDNWDQKKIEGDLGVKGKYRSFGGGDFGDMSRNMASWMGRENALREKSDITTKPTSNPFNIKFNVNSSLLTKKQQGGKMNEQELQQLFLQYLAEKTGAKSESELQQVIKQLGQDGLKQAYAQFVQDMQQQQVQAAKFGAKLNYIKRLNGQCPDGFSMQYYKVGGKLCKKCMKNAEKEKEITDPIKSFKCGRKIKKN